MLGRWSRSQYFEKTKNCHVFSFIAESECAIITRIDVVYTPPEKQIHLAFSPIFSHQLIEACKHLSIAVSEKTTAYRQYATAFNMLKLLKYQMRFPFFTKHEVPIQASQRQIKFNAASIPLNEAAMQQIAKLFHHFNTDMTPQPFPKELVDDLTAITMATSADAISFKTPSIPQTTPNFNKKAYKQLVDDLGTPTPSQYRKHLSEVTPSDNAVNLPLMMAVYQHTSTEPLEMMLWYKFNPFTRNRKRNYTSKDLAIRWMFSFSPFEVALAAGMTTKADMIVRHHSAFNRRHSPTGGQRIMINHVEFSHDTNSVFTLFQFTNGATLKLFLMRIAELSPNQREQVFNLFAANFEKVDGKLNLREIFNKDFNGNKYIEIICDGEETVGFNVFEIIDLDKNIFLHCAYGAIAERYRSYGIMTLLSFRPAYALQLLYPDKKVGIAFCALHYNSYRVIDFPHYPKYPSNISQPVMRKLLGKIVEQDLTTFSELPTFVREQLAIKSTETKPAADALNQRMFKRHLLKHTGNMTPISHPRSVPVAFMIGSESHQHITTVSAALGILFNKHINDYAPRLASATSMQMRCKM